MRGVPRPLPSLAALGAAAVLCAGCADADAGGEPGSLPQRWEKGMNLTAYEPDAFGSVDGDRALATLKATGTSHVAVVPTWYMDSATSTSVAPDREKTPSDESVLHAMRSARALGLTVALKPHVDLRDGSFRGQIAPSDIAAWFAGYRAMVSHYAELAGRGGADLFVVGTELTATIGQVDRWRAVIADSRRLFRGRLSYAANWVDEAEKVRFWKDLDLIGVDAYMPLVTEDEQNPPVPRLVDAWKPFVERLKALHERVDRPLVLSELGYESRLGTAAKPQGGAAGTVSQVAQANAYEAAFRAWSDQGFLRGIYWWDWTVTGTRIPAQDGGYSPEGKAGEAVLRRWNGAPASPLLG